MQYNIEPRSCPTSQLASVPLAFFARYNLSQRVTFISLFEKLILNMFVSASVVKTHIEF